MLMDCLKIQASEAGDLRRLSSHVRNCRFFAYPLSSQVITAYSINGFHSLYAEGGPRPVKAQFWANEARFSAWPEELPWHSQWAQKASAAQHIKAWNALHDFKVAHLVRPQLTAIMIVGMKSHTYAHPSYSLYMACLCLVILL